MKPFGEGTEAESEGSAWICKMLRSLGRPHPTVQQRSLYQRTQSPHIAKALAVPTRAAGPGRLDVTFTMFPQCSWQKKLFCILT